MEASHLLANQKQAFKIYTKAGGGFCVAARENEVVVVHSEDHHETQHWYKCERFVSEANDEQGQHCFALVNKATGKVMKHSVLGEQVTLVPYDPEESLELSVLWTESDDIGDGYKIIRLVNDIKLCMHVIGYPYNEVKDGTHIILFECWNGENQQWKFTPYSNSYQDVGDEEQRTGEECQEIVPPKDYKELLSAELKELYHLADYHKAQAHIFEMSAREKSNLMFLNDQALPEAAEKRFLGLGETSKPVITTLTGSEQVEAIEKLKEKAELLDKMKCLEQESCRLKEQSNLFKRQLEELKAAAQTRNEQDTRLRDAIVSLHKDLEQEKAELMEKLRNVEIKCLEQEGQMKDQSSSFERQLEELKRSAQTRQEEPRTNTTTPTAPVAERPVSPPATTTTTTGIMTEAHKRRIISLLEQYFRIGLVGEAELCIKELQSPSYHGEIVKEAISLGLYKNPPCVEPVFKLLEHLLVKKVFTPNDIGTGCLLYGSMMDKPKAPVKFGEIMSKLVFSGGISFSVVKEVLKKVQDQLYQKLILNQVFVGVSSGLSGQRLLEAQAADVKACQHLFSVSV